MGVSNSLVKLICAAAICLTGCDLKGITSKEGVLDLSETIGSSTAPPSQNRTYYLKSNFSNLCFQAATSPAVVGANVTQGPCAESTSLKFEEIPVTGETFKLKVLGTELCLQIPNASLVPDEFTDLGSCEQGAMHQVFSFEQKGASGFLLKVMHSGQCLNVESSLLTAGAHIEQWTCGTATNVYANQFFSTLDSISVASPPGDGIAAVKVSQLLDDMRLKNDLPWAARNPSKPKGWDYGPGYISQGLMYGDSAANWYLPTDTSFRSANKLWPQVRPWWRYLPGDGHNGANDYRIHIRYHETYLLYRGTNQWVRISQLESPGGSAEWYDDRQVNLMGSAPRVTEADGMYSYQVPPGNNCMFAEGNFWFESNPTDVIALHTRMEVRLVGPGAASPNIKPQFQVGANYATTEYMAWEDGGRVGPRPGAYLPGVGTGRLRILTPNWQTFTFTTVKPDSYNTVMTPHNPSRKSYLTEAELNANLPPGVVP
jgi:hypothetical protein